METFTVDVAIVGAGQSGMAAAYELNKLGVGNFIVIEARDRVGGRTVTQDLGDGATGVAHLRQIHQGPSQVPRWRPLSWPHSRISVL